MTESSGQQRLTLKDVGRQKFVRSPAVSPDGRWVAFSVETFRARDDDRVENLYIAPVDGSEAARRLTRGPTHDQKPAWSSDGRYLAFLSTRPDELEVAEAKPPADAPADQPEREDRPQVWVLDLVGGGEPRQVTARDEGVQEFRWAPGGHQLAIVARDPSAEQAAYLKAIRDKKKPGPLVLDRVQFKYDGAGYLDSVPTHLFVVDVPTRSVRQLTFGPASEHHPDWSPDGSELLFLSNRTGDPDNNARTDVWLMNSDGTNARRLTRGDVGASAARFAPDGRRVAFVTAAAPENSYQIERLVVVAVADATPVANLAECIGDGWSSVGGIVPDDIGAAGPVAAARVYPVPTDHTPYQVLTQGLPGPVMGAPLWLAPDRLLAVAADHGQWRVMEIHAPLTDHPPTWRFVAPADRLGSMVALDGAGGSAVVLWDRADTGGELWRLGPALDGEAQRITRVNDWLSEREVSIPRWIQFPSPSGGYEDAGVVEGLVFFPPGYQPGHDQPLPLMTAIHGGPMAFDSSVFGFDEQYWAARGYLVLQVNYHGSISYGEAFCRSIQGDWGPREHADVMAGVDFVVSQGWADPDRLFCTGFSQGGIMTNWAVGHTDRFRAAVSEHGMWDYVSAYGTDDCHLWWQDDLGVPWQNQAGYRRIAPESGLTHIQTPLLITAGEVDWRCPLSQAEQLYTALKKRGVPTELVVYQGEHHAITRPARWADRLSRIDGWLAKYGGVPVGPES